MSLTATEIPILRQMIEDGVLNCLLHNQVPTGRPPYFSVQNYAALAPLVAAVPDASMRTYMTAYSAAKIAFIRAQDAQTQAIITAEQTANDTQIAMLQGKIGV